jgi:hypothetical protein
MASWARDDEWEPRKDQIIHLYREKTLKQVADYMKARGFNAKYAYPLASFPSPLHGHFLSFLEPPPNFKKVKQLNAFKMS